MNLDLFEDIIKDLKECKSFCNSNLACTKMFRRRILHRLSAIVAISARHYNFSFLPTFKTISSFSIICRYYEADVVLLGPPMQFDNVRKRHQVLILP
ncbi:unnamed protein product [Rhizophagus irregularis]|nr:unnamed protein product [Rhizophagus irregularis]